MRKILMTVIAVGALTVPVGVTFAQSDTPDPTEPVPECEDHERVRDRDRVHEHDPAGLQGQERARHQHQLESGDGSHDCAGDHTQDRERVGPEEGPGGQVQARSGEMSRGVERAGNS